MPRHRFSKPWLHQASGYYCTSNNGKRLYLDKDYRVACRKLRELRAEERRGVQPAQQWEDAPFADLADQFLEDLKRRKKPTSYRSYRNRLLRALRIIGSEVRVGEVRKLHLAKIEQELTATHSPTTVKDTIAAVQTVFNWAVRYELILDNPVRSYQKPRVRASTIVDVCSFDVIDGFLIGRRRSTGASSL